MKRLFTLFLAIIALSGCGSTGKASISSGPTSAHTLIQVVKAAKKVEKIQSWDFTSASVGRTYLQSKLFGTSLMRVYYCLDSTSNLKQNYLEIMELSDLSNPQPKVVKNFPIGQKYPSTQWPRFYLDLNEQYVIFQENARSVESLINVFSADTGDLVRTFSLDQASDAHYYDLFGDYLMISGVASSVYMYDLREPVHDRVIDASMLSTEGVSAAASGVVCADAMCYAYSNDTGAWISFDPAADSATNLLPLISIHGKDSCYGDYCYGGYSMYGAYIADGYLVYNIFQSDYKAYGTSRSFIVDLKTLEQREVGGVIGIVRNSMIIKDGDARIMMNYSVNPQAESKYLSFVDLVDTGTVYKLDLSKDYSFDGVDSIDNEGNIISIIYDGIVTYRLSP